MQTPRSSFYYKPNKSSARESDLADKINEIALQFPSYGGVRVTAALRREEGHDFSSFNDCFNNKSKIIAKRKELLYQQW